MYSGALNRFEPNPSLRPERALSAKFGLAFIRAGFDLQAVTFQQRIDDAVVRITLPSNQFQRVNRDQFASTGVELTAGAMLGHTSLRGDLTLQRARIADRGIAEPTLRLPEDVPEVFGSVVVVMPLTRGYEVQSRLRSVGAVRCGNPSTGALQSQRGGAALDLGLERWWTSARAFGRVSAALQVENAFDAAIYDKCGLP